MFQNPMQMIQAFNQFKQTFSGDPQKEVERLVREGKITQPQLIQLQEMANQFMMMLKRN